MSECLVTKLKGAVNDSSLLRLGELRIIYQADAGGSTDVISLTSSVEQTVSVIGGGAYISLSDGGEAVSSVTLEAGVPTPIYGDKEHNFELYVPNKYALTALGDYSSPYRQSTNFGYDLSDLEYSADLKILHNGTPGTGDLSELRTLNNVKLFSLIGDNYTGDISYIKEKISPDEEFFTLQLVGSGFSGDIANLVPAEQCGTVYIQNNNTITGDIAALSTIFPNLRYLYLNGIDSFNKLPISGEIDNLGITTLVSLDVHRTEVGGTVEGFVAKQRELGNKTGSITFSYGNSKVTFQGGTSSILTGNTLSWTETTITLGETTITA